MGDGKVEMGREGVEEEMNSMMDWVLLSLSFGFISFGGCIYCMIMEVLYWIP